MKRLIEDIKSLVDDLIELYPVTQASQQKLCIAEVAEISAKEDLPTLETIVKSQDKLLEEAIAEAMKQKSPAAPNISFSGSHNSGFQSATNTGTISNLR